MVPTAVFKLASTPLEHMRVAVEEAISLMKMGYNVMVSRYVLIPAV